MRQPAAGAPGAITVRDAVEEDLAALRDVFRRASWTNVGDRPLFEEHPEFLEWSGAGIAEGRTRVAVVDGEIAGFASIELRGDVVELEDIFVDPDRMRSGVARALIADLVDHAPASATHIGVDANSHAAAFYRSAGFVGNDLIPLEHGTAIRMIHPLGVTFSHTDSREGT